MQLDTLLDTYQDQFETEDDNKTDPLYTKNDNNIDTEMEIHSQKESGQVNMEKSDGASWLTKKINRKKMMKMTISNNEGFMFRNNVGFK